MIPRCAALLAPCLALAAPAAAAPPPLEVVVAPDHLTLGVDVEARVEIRGPEDLEEVSLSASAGELHGLERLAPGRFAAAYRPPARRLPQVALVAALGRSKGELAVGCASLPLWGQGDAVIRTRPGAEVSVTIGTMRFGPIVADAKGVGVVPVVVPPGVREAFQGSRAIDLGVPPAPRIHLALERPSVRADRTESLRIFAFAAAANGGAERSAPRLAVDRGALEPLPPPGPGVAAAVWTLPPGAAGEVLARAELNGGSPSRAERPLRVEPGPPARIALRTESTSHTAGEADLAVEIEVVDAAGNPVREPPQLRASAGAATAPVRTPEGAFAARVALPSRLSSARELTLVADAGGGLSARVAVALAPARPFTLRLDPARAELVADGRAALPLKLRVEDRFGNAIEAKGLSLVARATAGEVRARWAEGIVEYLAARGLAPGSAAVEVAGEGLAARADVDLYPAVRSLRLAPAAGVATDARSFGAPWLGAQAAWRFPMRRGAIAAGAEVSWLRRARSEEIGGARVDGAQELLSGDLAVGWLIPMSPRWQLSVQAGAGATQVASAVRLGSQPTVRERAAVANGFAGIWVGPRVGPGGPFAEVRAWLFGAPPLTSVRGGLFAVSWAIGWSYEAI